MLPYWVRVNLKVMGMKEYITLLRSPVLAPRQKEVVFTKTEMNDKWNVRFLRNIPIVIHHTYSLEYSTGWRTSDTLLFFIFINIVRSYAVVFFLFFYLGKKKNYWIRSGECRRWCTCTILCFGKYYWAKVLRSGIDPSRHVSRRLDVMTQLNKFFCCLYIFI